jgi:hypothetical protein
MSYDLVVWEGSRPSSRSEAERTYEELMDADDKRGDQDMPAEPLTPGIDALLTDVTMRWPDGIDVDESAPWAMCPLRDGASGGVAIFCMTVSPLLDEVVAYIAQLARRHGLTCYDPQREEVIS